MEQTYIIAEAGSCHDGQLEKALALIRAAADAGADGVKFQYWSDPDALADRRRADAFREVYRRYQIRDEWLPALKVCAQAVGIDFLCTAYLPSDVPFLARYVRHFKVASFEAGAEDLIEAHVPFLDADMTQRAVRRRPEPMRWLVVSAGMGTDTGGPPRGLPGRLVGALRYLHCVSAYPAPVEALNLRVLGPREDGASYDGFSDHSDPALTLTGALAVAAGARIVEAHLRLGSTAADNPDAPHAMIPAQFTEYARYIRLAEQCLGDGRPGIHESEAAMSQYRVRAGGGKDAK